MRSPCMNSFTDRIGCLMKESILSTMISFMVVPLFGVLLQSKFKARKKESTCLTYDPLGVLLVGRDVVLESVGVLDHGIGGLGLNGLLVEHGVSNQVRGFYYRPGLSREKRKPALASSLLKNACASVYGDWCPVRATVPPNIRGLQSLDR